MTNREMDILKFELKRCQNIWDTDILGTDNVLALSALTEILIRFNYILTRLADIGHRVKFTEDIKEGDITKLVNDMRNAVCHSESPLNKIGEGVLKYCVFKGYCPTGIKMGNIVLGCNYSDDIAICFGDKAIYLQRHIGKLLKDLPPVLNSLNPRDTSRPKNE